jgi:hypothetical protein
LLDGFFFCIATNYNSVDDEVDHKIYVKIMCPACLGGKRSGIFGNCPYCNRDRTTYVEASIKTIKENLCKRLTDEEKKDLIDFLKRDNEKK